MLKSFTTAERGNDCVQVLHPATVTDPMFPKLVDVVEGVVLAVGVKTTVAVTVEPAFKVPIVQLTRLPEALPQLPVLTFAEVNDAPALGRLSVKITLLAASPVFVIV